MMPVGRQRLAIGYRYNAQKVLSFIVTENAGSTQTGLPYLSKYPDQFIIPPSALLLVPLSCLSYLEKLTMLPPTTNQGSLIWRWRSSGLLSVVGCGYVLHILWE